MRVHTKPIDLYRAQLEFFRTTALTRSEGHRVLARQSLAKAQDLTSGTLSRSQTRGAFARNPSFNPAKPNGARRRLSPQQLRSRGLPGAVPLLPINMQSQSLHNSFYLEPVAGGGIQSFKLGERDPGGGIWRLKPGGTRKMVDSGFFEAIKSDWRARNKAFIDYYRDLQRRT